MTGKGISRLTARLKTFRERIATRAKRNRRLTVLICIFVVTGGLPPPVFANAFRPGSHLSPSGVFRPDPCAERCDGGGRYPVALRRHRTDVRQWRTGGRGGCRLAGVRGIAVANEEGLNLRRSGETIDMYALAPMVRSGRTVVGTGGEYADRLQG